MTFIFSGELTILWRSRSHERSCVYWVIPNLCYHFWFWVWGSFVLFFSCLDWMGFYCKFFIYLCDFVCVSVHKQGQRTPCRVQSLLPLCGILGSNTGSQACRKSLHILSLLVDSRIEVVFVFPQRKSSWVISSNAFPFFLTFVLSLLFSSFFRQFVGSFHKLLSWTFIVFFL